ncbi:torsin-1A-interacting protein 2 [Megalobrama amblycephala]|uniref:torsin-1A-interacting protein 2 n=1 Tax=Megalobrama amblycephala TaxID=75352 RepID=UPI0020147383|nr:torsin-1A-interacting protein 2 [Megalobrama amblycephala]
MDSGDSKENGSTTRRRSTRHAPRPALYSADLKPRPPLKRSRNMREDDEASRAVNGSKESEESKNHEKEDDDETPVKMQKLGETEKASDTNESGDGFKHADVEMGEDEDQDQDMNSDEEDGEDCEPSLKVDSSAQSGTVEKHPACAWGENLKHEGRPNQTLGNQMPIRQITMDAKIHKTKTGTENFRPNTTSLDPASLRTVPLEILQDASRMRNKNSLNQNLITEKDKNAPCPGNWNRCPPKPPMINVYQTFKRPIANQTAQHKKMELKNLQKPVISKTSPVSSSRGWLWYMCKILLRFLILAGLLIALGFLAYKIFLWSYLPQTDRSHSETKEKFDLELTALKKRFPGQHKEFWIRSGKHLKSHLGTINPTEPVSVILTAGLQAERTLSCLAQDLAMAYSKFRNASILEIDGTTKSAKDSDQVKLEIDEALKEAFEGDKPAAVVHRFEELPPGSTLIFYRYCDHENAAYKKVFLVFTVMLSVNAIDQDANLSVVEDMVYDHIKQKFVSSDTSAKFNQMDVDKLSGLWSRISHVILPVAPVEKIEQQGCRD